MRERSATFGHGGLRLNAVVAVVSLKEGLSAGTAAAQFEAVFREVHPKEEFVKVPMADDGEGTVAAP